MIGEDWKEIMIIIINDEKNRRMLLFMRPLEYGITKNEAIFPEEFGYDDVLYDDYEMLPDLNIVDYTDTFILEYDNPKDWTVGNEVNDTMKCNDVILSFIEYAICIDETGFILFQDMEALGDDSEDVQDVIDEPVKAFYDVTDVVVSSELDSTILGISEVKDWSEIYEVHSDGSLRKKMCNYIAMITLCVEGVDTGGDVSILDDMKVYIGYASDIQNRFDLAADAENEAKDNIVESSSGVPSWLDFFGVR